MIVENKKVKQVSYIPVWIDDDTFIPEIVKPDDERFMKIINYMTEITESQNITPHFTIKGEEVIIG